MYDEDEKSSKVEESVIEIEEDPNISEHKSDSLKEDLELLRRRVVALEDDMRIVKEKLKRMSFAPGL